MCDERCEFEPRQPGHRVYYNHHRKVVIESKDSLKGEKKFE